MIQRVKTEITELINLRIALQLTFYIINYRSPKHPTDQVKLQRKALLIKIFKFIFISKEFKY